MIEGNFKMYREAEEPGIAKNSNVADGSNRERAQQLKEKEIADEPGTSNRTKMRRNASRKGQYDTCWRPCTFKLQLWMMTSRSISTTKHR